MFSFTAKVKSEIIENKTMGMRFFKAYSYGVLLFSKSFSKTGISFLSYSEVLRDNFLDIIKKLSGKDTDISIKESSNPDKKHYKIDIRNEDTISKIMDYYSFGEDNLLPDFISSPEEKAAFAAGAFISCGSLSDPRKSYHLELQVKNEDYAALIYDILQSSINGAKILKRKSHYIIYFKDCLAIQDALTFIGASKSALELIDIEMIKQVRNKANRQTNCETANIDKTVEAASKQIEDINYLFSLKDNPLNDDLKDIARLRTENPLMSLKELADISKPKISRSSIYHRLNRISKIADEIRNKAEESL